MGTGAGEALADGAESKGELGLGERLKELRLTAVYRALGRLKESLECAQEALRLLRNLNDPRAEAYVLTSLA